MSDLLRQSVGETPPRPKPNPISLSEPPDTDDHPSSDSSSSSADSTTSINTVRPSSREQPPPPEHWSNYFAQELFLTSNSETSSATYHVYLTPPTNPKKGPLFICHHGAGASGLSFALFAHHLRLKLPDAGILSLEARAHGSSTVTSLETGEEIMDFSLATLAADALAMITLTQQKLSWPSIPPCVLIGHSLGGAITTQLAADFALGTALIGACVVDVVEGSALEALGHMKSHLSSRPASFPTIPDAVTWHTHSRTLRNAASASISVPPLFIPAPNGSGYVWRTPLSLTVNFWWDWFTSMSIKFLSARCAKLLILAGTDRLDKELMIGQMQGKFQLVVIPEAGHFVQEDVPEKTAEIAVEFFRRNDRSAMVLPPKVSDLIAQGKKV